PRLLASSARLCRAATRPSDIVSSCCSRFEDGAASAGAACGTEAIVSLEDCQAKAAATPIQNVIGNAIASEVRLSSDGHLIMNPSFFGAAKTFGSSRTSDASSDGLLCQWPTENHDRAELSTEFTCRLPSSG